MFDLNRFDAVVPTCGSALRRLNHLLRTGDGPPCIVVLGKYNHGKSTLLNAFVGADHFMVADKRETVAVSEYEHDGVVWVDTPGLDVDPTETDDPKAYKAAYEIADFLLLVHRVTEGDLDKYEIKAFCDLAKQAKYYRQKMVLVLTQIDQAEEPDVAATEEKCRTLLHKHDVTELDIMSVSARRYRDPRLRRKSGMDDLISRVARWKTDTASLRIREWDRLTTKVLLELDEKEQDAKRELATATHRRDDVQRRLRLAVTKRRSRGR